MSGCTFSCSETEPFVIGWPTPTAFHFGYTPDFVVLNHGDDLSKWSVCCEQGCKGVRL